MNNQKKSQQNRKNKWFWTKFKESQILPVKLVLEFLEATFVFILLIILIRQGIFDKRYIPTGSMLPNLQIGDQLVVEKVSVNLHKFFNLGTNFKRGDIVVFYPPYQADGQKIKKDFVHTFVRLTGFSPDAKIGNLALFSFMPETKDAYIKRIVALPGEELEIISGKGILINGKKLFEPYLLQPAFYDLKTYYDIYQNALNCGCLENPALNKKTKIIVPKDSYFVLGDNRNNSKDSHCWGFLKKERILGKAVVTVWRDLGLLRPY